MCLIRGLGTLTGVAIALCAVNAGVLGQNTENRCPIVKLAIPPGAVQIEQEARVIANLFGDLDPKAISFIWTVSSGKIVSGQGTAVATIVPGEDDEGTNIKVSVRIDGLLPEGCPREAFDFLPVEPLPIGEPCDELGEVG